ncbi:MAG: FAD-dependent oxidoreductase [Clostridium sp.]|uniref:FAD-dependent oxidoreductase n=1 Tax=Clostridium sp. TaxID=1506 RepID=UPI003D6C9722
MKYIEGRITEIDAQNKCVKLENHEIVSFDMLSLDAGSEMVGKSIEGVTEYALRVKPLENLFKMRTDFVNQTFDGRNVVIVGAGAAGIEITFALKALSSKLKRNIKITLVHRGNLILKGYHENVRKKIIKKLKKDKINVLSEHKISKA